ncbi:hypothetical protein [Streptomyces sp. DH10]|uniref:hypothetical protein n=1 Tax=Streptomyces sp. DH10 TaxID=3040121 RepID=UPI002442D292|nr:hypothetical protein [Streptomyces sp. DH10]MDG9708070.1 hypothetical protein [Streptomyces sp. DH10]
MSNDVKRLVTVLAALLLAALTFELPAGRSVWSATGYGSLASLLEGFNSRSAKAG